LKLNARLVPAALGLLAVSAALAGAGCKCSGDRSSPRGVASAAPSAASSVPATDVMPREALFWDFLAPDEPTLLSLWPPDAKAPKASAPGIRTTNEEGAAVVVVEGTNPHAEWTFNPPVKARLFSLELDSPKIAPIEVSWRSRDCPAQVEACAAKRTLGIGREFVEFVLPVREISGVRIGFPDEIGYRLVVHRMRFIAKPKATGGWRPGSADVHLNAVPQGFQITCDKPDPSIMLQAAGLDASLVDGLDVEVGVGEFVPQLFWVGTGCPNFSEDCSVRVTPGAAQGTFTAVLAGHPRWTGRIEGFRFDPGNDVGVYVVKRLILRRKLQ
jgi:hypothetical protein